MRLLNQLAKSTIWLLDKMSSYQQFELNTWVLVQLVMVESIVGVFGTNTQRNNKKLLTSHTTNIASSVMP